MLVGEEDDQEDEHLDPDLLAELRRRMDEGLSPEQRQEIVRLLVRDITIHTGSDSARSQRAVIRYRFDGAVATCTDRGSWRPPA